MSVSEQGNIKRVVFDTNVIVSASLSRNGNPAKIYRMFFAGVLPLVYCEEILAEYEDVLYRPHLKIPSEEADIVMTTIRQYGEEVRPLLSVHAMIDEDDRIFYDTAKSAGEYLITGNTKHYPNETFVLTPTAFLELR
jgi:putative PIN family toxin of toxin-antitoxin system